MKLTKRKTKKLLNQKGFSLVELMVVVAIIGILAAIAIPNYQRFQRKAQQAEAKGLMSGIYSAEITFASEHGFATPNIDQAGFSPDGSVQYRVGFSTNTLSGTGTINPNSKTRIAGYRGPLPRKVTDLDTIELCQINGTGEKCDLAPGITATSVAWTTVQTVLGTCSPPTGGSGCTATNSADCANASSSGCLDSSSNAAAGSWTNGEVQINNTNRYQPTFTMGAVGDIGGATEDVWVMNQSKVMQNVQDGTQ